LNGALHPHKAHGKILVCLEGQNSKLEKGVEASRVGAIGMILVIERESGGEVIVDAHVLQASNVNFTWAWQWSGVGTGFTFPVLIPDSHILTRYPTHTQRG